MIKCEEGGTIICRYLTSKGYYRRYKVNLKIGRTYTVAIIKCKARQPKSSKGEV